MQNKDGRDLTSSEIELLHEMRTLSAQVGALVDKLQDNADTDKRSLEIARTELQTGFMWLTRSVANPTSF